jgi:flagellar basal body-associated protein FliL
VKHKRPKTLEFRSYEKEKARRKGKWRMAVLAVLVVVIAVGALTYLLTVAANEPTDPNAAKAPVPAKPSR